MTGAAKPGPIFIVLASVLAAITAARAASAQETAVGTLIGQARQQLEAINPDSAASLLRQALDPRAGATVSEKLRAFVLFGITELIAGRTNGAQRAFHEALVLQPDLKVDSLADLHEALVVTFEKERAVLAAAGSPAPGMLEIRGLPAGAQLTVDGAAWSGRRQQVPPGMRKIEVTARGFLPYSDSIMVESGVTLVRDVALERSDLARLSVSSVPWGVVYLDSMRVGETPVFELPVPAGSYTLRIQSPSRREPIEEEIELEPGRVTNLGTYAEGEAPAPSPAPFVVADSMYRELELDSALARYVALAQDTVMLRAAQLRARAATRAAMILYAMGTSRKDASRLDRARSYFGVAFRLAPRYEPNADEMGPEMLSAMVAARARVLGLVAELPTDTQMPPREARLPIPASPTHLADVRLTITSARSTPAVVYADSQLAGTTTIFSWNLRAADGSLLPTGNYRVLVTATDSAGRTAPVFDRFVTVERVTPDTVVHPAPLPASSFAPEFVRISHASPGVFVTGAALVAGAVALDRAMANSALSTGLPRSSGSYIVAGSVSLATVIGFLAGHRVRLLPENARRNSDLREQYERDLQSVIMENARRRQDAPVRVRVLEGS